MSEDKIRLLSHLRSQHIKWLRNLDFFCEYELEVVAYPNSKHYHDHLISNGAPDKLVSRLPLGKGTLAKQSPYVLFEIDYGLTKVTGVTKGSLDSPVQATVQYLPAKEITDGTHQASYRKLISSQSISQEDIVEEDQILNLGNRVLVTRRPEKLLPYPSLAGQDHETTLTPLSPLIAKLEELLQPAILTPRGLVQASQVENFTVDSDGCSIAIRYVSEKGSGFIVNTKFRKEDQQYVLTGIRATVLVDNQPKFYTESIYRDIQNIGDYYFPGKVIHLFTGDVTDGQATVGNVYLCHEWTLVKNTLRLAEPSDFDLMVPTTATISGLRSLPAEHDGHFLIRLSDLTASDIHKLGDPVYSEEFKSTSDGVVRKADTVWTRILILVVNIVAIVVLASYWFIYHRKKAS